MDRKIFIQRLENKIPARWHMSIICLSTISAGLLLSKGIHFFKLADPMIRYGVSVLFSYGVFIFLIYLWLKMHFGIRRNITNENDLNTLDVVGLADLGGGSKVTPEAKWEGMAVNLMAGEQAPRGENMMQVIFRRKKNQQI